MMISLLARRVVRFPTHVRFVSTPSHNQDVENVQKVEDELFGKYYGETDSSDIKSGQNRRRRAQNFSKPVPNAQTKIPKTPNPWGIQRLPLHDPIFGRMIQDARNRTKTQQRIVVEGKRLIQDALIKGLAPKAVFVSEEELLEELSRFKGDLKDSSIYRVARKDLMAWSALTTPPGIMAIFDKPEDIAPPQNCLPITVICDNIKEPRNLGSIIRVAAALPCSQVIVTKGSTDPWDSKCLRGGSGGQFHIPIEYPMRWQHLSAVASRVSQIFLADNKTGHSAIKSHSIDEQLIQKIPADQHIFIVIGGETHGISKEAFEFASTCADSSIVNIPMAQTVESLNTASALAVILYEMRRQLLCLED